MPHADLMYGCDARWWNLHDGCPDFHGQKWSTHEGKPHSNNKEQVADDFGVSLVRGCAGVGFSTNPALIHYGDNSGFQTLNLAVLLGSTYIVLVGFDMRFVGGKSHFFGDHDGIFQRVEYGSFAAHFDKAPPPPGVQIINATPSSAINCYPRMHLDDALAGYTAA